MKKLLIVALLFSINIFAEEKVATCVTVCKLASTKEENIKKLSDLLFNKEQMSSMMGTMIRQGLSMQPNFSEDLAKKMTDMLVSKFNSPETLKAYNLLFEEFYTEKEVADILDFYLSTTGKKCLEVMPKLAAKAGQIGAKIAQEVMVELMAKPEAAKEPKPLVNDYQN